MNQSTESQSDPSSIYPSMIAFDWYDEYAHGLIDRREFMARLSGLAVLGLTMTTLTSALIPKYAQA